jgi:hypothetical protein
MKLGLCPKPRFGGNSYRQPLWCWLTLEEDARQLEQKILNPFDFGAVHARARPWVI